MSQSQIRYNEDMYNADCRSVEQMKVWLNDSIDKDAFEFSPRYLENAIVAQMRIIDTCVQAREYDALPHIYIHVFLFNMIYMRSTQVNVYFPPVGENECLFAAYDAVNRMSLFLAECQYERHFENKSFSTRLIC